MKKNKKIVYRHKKGHILYVSADMKFEKVKQLRKIIRTFNKLVYIWFLLNMLSKTRPEIKKVIETVKTTEDRRYLY